ncbi:hypothetical protein BGZ49_004395 [Haplosporangium sp. Z 27]|nr:hypothetical protein BGZ49_004395 [Haplosporangium sp. Z 27]
MKMEPISTKGELMICRSPIDMKDDPNFIPTPQQQKRRTTSSAGEFLPKLESDPMEIIGSVHPNTIQSDSRLSASTSVLLPSAIPASSSNDSSNNNIATSSTTSYLLLSSNRFQSNTSTIRQLPVLRSFMFVLSRILHFPKSVFTKGASAGRSYLQRLGIAHSTRIYYGSNTYNRAQSSSALRNHRRSMSESDSNSRQEAVQGRWRHHQFRSRSRSRSPTRLPNSRTNPIPTSLSSSLNSKGRYRDRLSKLLNSYKVQIAMVCVCLTGEAFVHCYHDAMLAMVIQGACNGLVPVSKCAIGEIANRQQHLHDAELVMDKHLEEQEELYREKQQQQKTSFPENILDEISDADYEKLETVHEEQHDHDSGYSRNSTSNTKVDIAAKGYSALVIAIALGAACEYFHRFKMFTL